MVKLKVGWVLVVLLLAIPLVGCGSQAADDSYAVDIDPADFVAEIDNPFFPLRPGTTYIYEGVTDEGVERVEDVVTGEVREVMGVSCVVVHDRVTLGGELVEETYDWYAQDREGNVWYFGEDSREYAGGQVVSTAGSWEAGKDGALPGIIMEANPAPGDSYRQEYYQGEAEDMAEVLSLTETAAVPLGDYQGVLMTREWTPLEPGVAEHKYYARDVGLILETIVEGGSGRIELIALTVE